MRPPLWLNAISSVFFGIFTLSTLFQGGSGRQTIIMYVSAFAFMATYFVWHRRSQLLGATARIFPSSFAGRLFLIAQAVFYSSVILGSKELFDNGSLWVPYAAAIINGVVFAYLSYNYPTTEWDAKAIAR